MSRSDLLQLTLKILGAAWHLILREIQQHPWTVAVALYGLARAFGVMIQSGQRGVLFRWGRPSRSSSRASTGSSPWSMGSRRRPCAPSRSTSRVRR